MVESGRSTKYANSGASVVLANKQFQLTSKPARFAGVSKADAASLHLVGKPSFPQNQNQHHQDNNTTATGVVTAIIPKQPTSNNRTVV